MKLASKVVKINSKIINSLPQSKFVNLTVDSVTYNSKQGKIIPQCYTECARDRDLYELVSCCKFVNEILFCVIYKTLYLTWGHHALGVILCLCLNFF